MNVGKIQAALSSATQETTLSLATCNFDFSIVKVEAPAEFQPLGSALSHKRRNTAENGQHHVIARRLATLFSSMIPKTQNLVRVYGQRASDTAKSFAESTPRSKSYGIFRDFVGFDGTTIWAAATSGPGAVELHLLACMLARVWSVPEAVSIWEELVSERKKELLDNHAELIRLEDAVATQLEITRDQLSQWDASARAWLRAADAVPLNSEKQIRIIDALGLLDRKEVSSSNNVFDSVCRVWKTALTTVDLVIGGSPHSVRDGAVLVALSAWHIYPDIILLSDENQGIKKIKQNDELVNRGGTVTVGLEKRSLLESQGVNWCLSLAHLQYYGHPVSAERGLHADIGRITVHELKRIALGAVLGSWGIHPQEVHEAIDLIIEIGLSVKTKLESRARDILPADQSSWMICLLDTAQTLKNDSPVAWKAINLGFRRYKCFTKVSTTKVFRLRDPSIVGLIAQTKHKLELYHSMIRQLDLPTESLLLRVQFVIHPSSASRYLFISVSPSSRSKENSSDSSKHPVYQAWTSDVELYRDDLKLLEGAGCSYDLCEMTGNQTYYESDTRFIWADPPSPFAEYPMSPTPQRVPDSDTRKKMPHHNPKNIGIKKLVPPSSSFNQKMFEILSGKDDNVTLYKCSDYESRASTKTKYLNIDLEEMMYDELSLEAIKNLIRERHILPPTLLDHLDVLSRHTDTEEIVASLESLMLIIQIYENLPGATISPQVLVCEPTIGRSLWAQMYKKRVRYPSTTGLTPPHVLLRDVFACIAMLESGSFDINPSQLEAVMAISVDDSLYIAASLLNDPASGLPPWEVRRVMGNIGKAGMTFLIPPGDPKIKRFDPTKWRTVNHEVFDGTLIDNFKDTSLHLSFTGYEKPLVIGKHGGKSTETFFIEAVVSLHGNGKWFADLDILASLMSPHLDTVLRQPNCASRPAGHTPNFYITAIDNWEELLDVPENPVVVRAHGNWQARLAALAVSIKLGHPTILFQNHGCWDCAAKLLKDVGDGHDTSWVDDSESELKSQVVFLL